MLHARLIRDDGARVCVSSFPLGLMVKPASGGSFFECGESGSFSRERGVGFVFSRAGGRVRFLESGAGGRDHTRTTTTNDNNTNAKKNNNNNINNNNSNSNENMTTTQREEHNNSNSNSKENMITTYVCACRP